MRSLALTWVVFITPGLARKLHAGAECDQHRKPAFEAESRVVASIGSENANILASLFFAVSPGVATRLRARSAIGGLSSITSQYRSCARQRWLAERRPRMVLGDDSEFEADTPIEFDQLRNSLIVGTMALALFLAPLDASAAPPQYKLDKTGWAGGAANVIEGGIDLVHNGLANVGVGGTYGLGILFFTVMVKIITYPLLNIQIGTATKMQKIAPIQQRIMKSYSDKQADKRQEVIAKLLKSANANPLASLLPSFAQIPIFISLYRALTNLIAQDKLEESFLWIPSLQGPVNNEGGLSWLFSAFSGNPTWGYLGTLEYLSLPVILWIVQSTSFKLSQASSDQKQEGFAKALSTIIPAGVSFFSLQVPAGLSLYWLFNSALTTVATQLLKLKYKAEELPPEVQEVVDLLDKRSEKKAARRAPKPKNEKGFQADITVGSRKKVKNNSPKGKANENKAKLSGKTSRASQLDEKREANENIPSIVQGDNENKATISGDTSSAPQLDKTWDEWMAYKDVEGNTYYYNPMTGTTDWTLPAGAKVGEWVAYKDSEGNTYYYNPMSGATEWSLPPDAYVAE